MSKYLLSKKRLYKQAWKRIEKAEEVAEKYHLLSSMIEAKMFNLYLVILLAQKEGKENFDEIFSALNISMHKLGDEIKMLKLYYEVFIGTAQSGLSGYEMKNAKAELKELEKITMGGFLSPKFFIVYFSLKGFGKK